MPVEPQTDGERIMLLAGDIGHLTRDVRELETNFAAHQRSVLESLGRIEAQLHRGRGFIGAFMLIGTVMGTLGIVLSTWVTKKLGLG